MRGLILLAVAAWAAAGAAGAQVLKPQLTLKSAGVIRDACLAEAARQKWPIAVSVFDHAGRLVAFARTDEASTAVGEIAQWKGKSAATYGFPSSETAKWNMGSAPFIATAGGGVPIFGPDGAPLGGVGVSGAQTEDDIACAEAGIKAAGLRSSR